MIRFGRPMRRRFLLQPGTAFLNHGSFGATPRSVLAAAARWQRRIEANPDRFMRRVLPRALRGAAARLAHFLNCGGNDLVFVENATAGVNAVLRSLRLRRGDEVLATTHTYNAVRQALRHACGLAGAKLVEAPIALPVASEGDLVGPIRENISGRTRLVVLDHIASPTGLIFPVRRLARLARAGGAQVLVDGAHAPGQVALDLPSLGADWYVGNCHKWLFAPKGCGFLWARRGAQQDLHPTVISHFYREGFTREFDWVGTRDFSAWLSVPEALAFYREMSKAGLRRYNHVLAADAGRRMSEAWGEPLDGPAALHGSMIAVRLPKRLQHQDPARLMHRWLERERTVVAVTAVGGALWARISAQVYNAPEDYDRLSRIWAGRARARR